MQAMILAAGFGTRLRPYTHQKAKPLFPVLNRPLLLSTIERLKRSGFASIIVNCHHLRDQVSEALTGLEGVIVQEEREILGTGGGLRRALGSMADAPVLVTNGDIYHSIDFSALYAFHVESGNDATMVLHDFPRFNSVVVRGDTVADFLRRAGTAGCLAYTGVQVVSPEIIDAIPPGGYFCIIEHYRQLIGAGRRINYLAANDIFWTDIGTPHDYLALHDGLLHGTIPAWPELDYNSGGSVLIDQEAWCDPSCRFEDWACIGKATVLDGVEICRSVVWDGAIIDRETAIRDMIVTPRYDT